MSCCDVEYIDRQIDRQIEKAIHAIHKQKRRDETDIERGVADTLRHTRACRGSQLLRRASSRMLLDTGGAGAGGGGDALNRRSPANQLAPLTLTPGPSSPNASPDAERRVLDAGDSPGSGAMDILDLTRHSVPGSAHTSPKKRPHTSGSDGAADHADHTLQHASAGESGSSRSPSASEKNMSLGKSRAWGGGSSATTNTWKAMCKEALVELLECVAERVQVCACLCICVRALALCGIDSMSLESQCRSMHMAPDKQCFCK
jgi:hypothetical protein